jgi:flagellar motor switch protein FliN/FliY
VSQEAGADAVRRLAELAAGAVATSFALLVADELTVVSEPVSRPSDELLAGVAFPLIAGEAQLTGAAEGSAWIVLAAESAATLAAAMMGTPEAVGDGLSSIELSAVSEALNQLLAATATALAEAVGASVEIGPVSCAAVADVAGAHARTGDLAHRADLRIASDGFEGELLLLVNRELADTLALSFAHAPAADALPRPAAASPVAPAAPRRVGDPALLADVRVRVSAELGRTRLSVGRIANLPAGAVVALDREPQEPVDVLVNGAPFAQARILLVDGEYAVQIISLGE